MSKNLKRIYITIAIVFVAFSVISFVLPYGHGAVFWVAYMFGVIAICIQAYVIPKAFVDGSSAKSKFYGFPIARVSVSYLVLQLILSLLFMALARQTSRWVLRIEIILSIVLLGVAIIGFFATDAIREEVHHQDTHLKKDVEYMRALQSQMVSLVNQCSDTETRAVLEKLSEAFRFSDPVSCDATMAIEEDLASYVDDMQNALLEEDNISIVELCAKTTPVLARRNQICKQNK